MKLSVSEFFYSLQGEGITTGIPAVFLRLAGCNLMCGGYGTERDGKLYDNATWRCDTVEVWRRGISYDFPTLLGIMEEQVSALTRLREGAHLVITGGEPLLQQGHLIELLEYMEREHQLHPVVEIETNATLTPFNELDERVSYWNTSPKLQNSGMPYSERIYPDVLRWFAGNRKTMSKFVISSEADWLEVKSDFVDKGLVNKAQIVLMPAASSIEELLAKNKTIADICIREGVRMCTRLHVEIWNQLTGV